MQVSSAQEDALNLTGGILAGREDAPHGETARIVGQAQDAVEFRIRQPPLVSGETLDFIGGLGSLPGAVLAGYLIGAATVLMQVVLPPDARPFRDAFVYGAVIVMLTTVMAALYPARKGARIEPLEAITFI